MNLNPVQWSHLRGSSSGPRRDCKNTRLPSGGARDHFIPIEGGSLKIESTVGDRLNRVLRAASMLPEEEPTRGEFMRRLLGWAQGAVKQDGSVRANVKRTPAQLSLAH